MQKPYILVFLVFLFFDTIAATECENGWVEYKDELCVRAFTENIVLNFNEAKRFCSSQGTWPTTATLVMVKEADMQELLENYTQDNFFSLWLGGKYDDESAQFKWEDGDPLTYTNWAEGYPRNISDQEACITLRPANSKSSTKEEGNWEDVNCQRRNVALCQQTMPWTLQDAIEEIVKLRKRDLELQDELDVASSERTALREELQLLNSRVVPVGSIYIEYYNQPNPQTFWPSLEWEDVTSIYAGLFFRAEGGGSDGWGTTQTECAPRVTQMSFTWRGLSNPEYPGTIDLPSDGWSQYGLSGYFHRHQEEYGSEGLSFNTQTCEIRPKNQTIRIWRRIA